MFSSNNRTGYIFVLFIFLLCLTFLSMYLKSANESYNSKLQELLIKTEKLNLKVEQKLTILTKSLENTENTIDQITQKNSMITKSQENIENRIDQIAQKNTFLTGYHQF